MLFPCVQRSPASMISHRELSSMRGARAMSGSAARRFRNRVMLAAPSINASSKLISMTLAPFSICWRTTVSASANFPSTMSLRNRGEPVTLARSPTMMSEPARPPGGGASLLNDSSPLRRNAGVITGTGRGLCRRVARAMARICSGVVPQHPPRMFTMPARANSRNAIAVSSGPSGKPVGASGSGNPALGWHEMKQSALDESSSM